MSKRKRRKPFETDERPKLQPQEKLIDTTSGVFAFFRDYGVRETIESIIVAVVLALLFRAYEAEAFIIPTGSMAPTLQGQHMDVVCDQCGYQYRAGASQSAATTPARNRATVTKTHCPICRHGMPMQRRNPDHVSNNGDRILVNKFIYDFKSPERFDVIVFKNPNNGKQNYIKRLIGLPGDNLLIENGDIYNFVTDSNGKMTREIVRKPADKVPVMLQLIDDTNHIADAFKKIDWPDRWSQWDNPGANWRKQEISGESFFVNSGESGDFSWLRYRHLVPRSYFDELEIGRAQRRGRLVDSSATDWEEIEKGDVPQRIFNKSKNKVSAGSLIRDYYEYNDRSYRYNSTSASENDPRLFSPGSHWVGDLGVEFEVQVESNTGTIGLDLVEGGVHFICQIDIETGKAQLSTQGNDGSIVFDTEDGNDPEAQTNLTAPGSYDIRYVHMDDMLYLWINGKYVDFDAASYTNNSGKRPVPRYSKNDPRDAEPIGIASKGAVMKIERIKVYRDVYYVAPTNTINPNEIIRNETGVRPFEFIRVYENPELWTSQTAMRIFQRPQVKDVMFPLQAGQYFPMGDNSPASQDARIWDGPNFVDEEYMIGRAMFIYWPHSLNSPVRYFPNFKRMGFIR